MVAPGYAAQRSALAKTLGLGRKPASSAKALAPEPVVAAYEAHAKKARKGKTAVAARSDPTLYINRAFLKDGPFRVTYIGSYAYCRFHCA